MCAYQPCFRNIHKAGGNNDNNEEEEEVGEEISSRFSKLRSTFVYFSRFYVTIHDAFSAPKFE